MRRFLLYLRQAFCWHDLSEPDELFCKEKNEYGTQQGIKVSVYCHKCGYHTSYWKF